MSSSKLSTAQHPELDVADIVTALVGMSPEVRSDVIERVIAELGLRWLEDLVDNYMPAPPKVDTPPAVLLSDGYYPPDEAGKVSEK